jgi:excisionase family DNA binding protein
MTGSSYTAEEIAKYLRVHPYTVKRLARANKIPGFKVGGQCLSAEAYTSYELA